MSGCISIVLMCNGYAVAAGAMIFLAAVFDFFDGFAARLLKAYSPLGAQLDSLSDVVSFGVAPSFIMYHYLNQQPIAHSLDLEIAGFNILPFIAFFLAVFAELRLAKFNIDDRQTSSFIGLPTPANALFWGSLVVGEYSFLTSETFNALYLLMLVLLMSWLLIAEIPMFSLKFKDLSWKSNQTSYLFLLVSIPLLFIFQASGFAAVILWYILLSFIIFKQSFGLRLCV